MVERAMPASAEAPPPPAWEVAAVAGTRVFRYPFDWSLVPTRFAVEVGASARHPSGVEGTLLARVSPPAGAEPSVALEAALRLEVAPAIGRWTPGAGFELGVSTRDESEALTEGYPPGSYFAAFAQPDPAWIDFTAAPLRFRAGPLTLGVARVDVGVSLLHFGQTARWALDPVTVGWTW